MTADGAVKVLDFGLAKATVGDAAGADLEPAPNVTAQRHDRWRASRYSRVHEPGAGAGQARRQAHRHLGVRLRAVRNADRARCVPRRHARRHHRESHRARARLVGTAAIHAGTRFKQLLLACLAKDSQERLQDIDDVTIDGILSGSASGTTTAPRVRRRNRRALWLTWAAAAATLVRGLIAWSRLAARPSRRTNTRLAGRPVSRRQRRRTRGHDLARCSRTGVCRIAAASFICGRSRARIRNRSRYRARRVQRRPRPRILARW